MPTSSLKDLVRNPLGIVALFISLIYGVASLLLGATASYLPPDERMWLIKFVIFFPLAVLWVFYLLVTRHHGKLYAPGDFKTDNSFLRTLSTEEVELKRKSEATEALPETEVQSIVPLNEQADVMPLAPEVSQPPSIVAKTRTIDASASPPSFRQFLEEVRRTEIAVIEKLEKEFGQPATRNVEISKPGVSFDAFFPGGLKATFVEVKLVARPMNSPNIIDKVLYSAMLADRSLNGRFKLILVVVYSFSKDELPLMERMLRLRVEKCPAEIDLRLLAYEDVIA
jgi:hypothetical protein